jgi:branched-chain amino acid transport system ATP-binding protein
MSPLLEVAGISKSFSGILALDRVDLAVEEGERVGLIGPNGAGKTTLFNCMLGVTRPTAGTVWFAGKDISGLPVHRRARLGIGRTFQRIELFSDSTVRDHLLVAERVRRGTGALWKDLLGLGRPKKDELRACDEMLELLGLSGLGDEPIESLSLGKGRLVEVGRALMSRPQLLLLDEPSSGLSRDETAALATTLREVQAEQRCAILLVEHDVELVTSFTERCYVLDFGHVIASGPTTTVMADARVREAYLGLPAEEVATAALAVDGGGADASTSVDGGAS